jgi:hypothetical protein
MALAPALGRSRLTSWKHGTACCTACHDSHIAVLIEWVWAVGHVLEYSRTSADYEG